MRLAFYGVIEGSTTVRAGETETQALLRAEASINEVLRKACKRLSRIGDTDGPIVGLEVAT